MWPFKRTPRLVCAVKTCRRDREIEYYKSPYGHIPCRPLCPRCKEMARAVDICEQSRLENE